MGSTNAVASANGVAVNLALHTRWTDDENRQDLSRLADYLHADIEVHQPGADTVVGIAAYRAMMTAMFVGLPNFHVALDDQFATDDRVVCRWRLSGVHSAESFGFPATGKRIEVPGLSTWDFEQGKARRGWIYVDLPRLMTQLGTP